MSDLNHAYERFQKALIKNSESKTYDEAKHEWVYLRTEVDSDSCICGVKIEYVNVFRNIKTATEINVGCDCYQNFRTDIDNDTVIKIDNCVSAIKGHSKHGLQFCKVNDLIPSKHIEFIESIDLKKGNAERMGILFKLSSKQKKYYNGVKMMIKNHWKKRNVIQLQNYLYYLSS
jgi:hypothetical protein